MFEKTEVTISDPNKVLKDYTDPDTTSGKPITRQFCGNCGRYVWACGSVTPFFSRKEIGNADERNKLDCVAGAWVPFQGDPQGWTF
jgi:hypothetical protein